MEPELAFGIEAAQDGARSVLFPFPEALMSISFRKFSFSVAALFAVSFAPIPASAADLVGGYHAPSQARHYREVRTTYVRREARDCQLLRVTDPDGSRVIEVCFKPIF
jgi:hypothetical protein